MHTTVRRIARCRVLYFVNDPRGYYFENRQPQHSQEVNSRVKHLGKRGDAYENSTWR